MNPDNVKIKIANLTLEEKYPEYGKDGKRLILEVSKIYPGKVVESIRGDTAKQGSYKSKCLVKARRSFVYYNNTGGQSYQKREIKSLGPEREAWIDSKRKRNRGAAGIHSRR